MRNREEARGAGGEAVRREVEHEVSGDKGWDWGGGRGGVREALGQCGLWRTWSRGGT